MPSNLIIVNPKRLEKLKKEFSKDGKKLVIFSDFDRTLTQLFVKGERIPSLASILRSSKKYLGKTYVKKAWALYRKYYPIEANLKLPFSKRKKAMEEWWREHFKLLIKSGLKRKHLKQIAKSPKIKFRRGVLKFFDFLRKEKIPLVVISSSGISGDVILEVLKRKRKLYPNIYVISNIFIWDKNGKVIDVKEPILHILNKNAAILKRYPFYQKIKKRKNVLLLGDEIDDIEMIKGFKYKNLIKIGFLNENVKEKLENYKKVFDILILNDSSFKYVNSLLKEIYEM